MNKLNTLCLLFFLVLVLVGCKHDVYDIDMVYVSGGDFLMGSEDVNADPDERPVHSVHVKDFYLGKYEVTQEQWKAVMKNNPSYHRGLKYPVENVSWDDCQLFIEKLNKKTGKKYRLPTEAEWEYVASMPYNKIKQPKIKSYAWYLGSFGKEEHDVSSQKVGSLKSNKLGIYDLIGNVNEWCYDSYDSRSYQKGGAKESNEKVFKGGCFANEEKFLRPANRNHIDRYTRHYTLGLRLAMDAK